MAIVTKLVHGTRSIRLHPTEVECEYQTFELDDRSFVLQLSTFGSAQRKTDGVSQTLQFTETAARQLMSTLHDVFPDLK